MKDILDLFGRLFLGALFLYEVVDFIFYADAIQEKMTLYGLTWRQDLLLNGAILCMLLGSVLVLIGYRSSFGAFLLLTYWLPVSLIVHAFWSYPDAEQREQFEQLMKNLAICGGLLLVLVNGSGRFSVKRLFSTVKV
jgi:putative oxidoreductase